MQDSFHCPMSEMYFALCKEVDTPISLAAWLRFKYSHKEFLELDIPVGDYLEKDIHRFKGDYAVVSALSKWKGLDTGVDLEAVALGKFASSEEKCRNTNTFLKRERAVPTNGTLNARLYCAKRKIARLLGPFSIHCISPFFEWGPGATYDIPRKRALVDTKIMTLPMTVGGRAKELLQSVIQLDLHWSGALLGVFPEGPWDFVPWAFERQDCCRVETVPKNAKTNRVIAIEPTGNLFIQKGVGGYFRRCLRRVGIDLNDQAVNQQLASRALGLDLATLDLRAASDTVSKELVYELLPYDWAVFLDSIRSHKASLPDGSEVTLQKFSSMGNGFTFELETLIFWALGSTVTDEIAPRGVLSVYGDDIICQKTVASELVLTLGFVGFDTNEEKSFVSGLFYESCGKHYFDGQDVTPFYQKKTFADVPEFVRSHNRIVRWSERVGLETRSHLPAYRHSPAKLRNCLIPYGVQGDDGFLCPIDDFVANSCDFSRNFGWRTRVVMGRTRSLPGMEAALLANSLRKSAYRDGPADPLGVRWNASDEGEPSYGDVTVDVHGRKPVSEDDVLIGHRWIIPPGVSPLPGR